MRNRLQLVMGKAKRMQAFQRDDLGHVMQSVGVHVELNERFTKTDVGDVYNPIGMRAEHSELLKPMRAVQRLQPVAVKNQRFQQ
mmetsp:Transcript_21949/g.47256  ORF Transcript_21949/g.47256 Transcript_21949/m.47256 type:complete len:84 (+) Transcript_21949:692-943(+)|eukprot:CAMPEP_0183337916 /NCGR_PEP_ID=MMETSP0164_2-20130417/5397_1 /TAXON_ID=221442 /ORGANISM="Coccolithus pelagicus ssp braarudi, Strain PLY182g" /LENGTH=83 /DNA_ID=CAMNT_0025507687 /DNA_START=672 /DNA_END=923 /DNA_ORIENTATION=-